VATAADRFLPTLRQELRIEPGAPLKSGAPSWTLFDPLRNNFYQLGRIEFLVFSNWARGTIDTIGAVLAREGVAETEAEETVAEVAQFALTHNLTCKPEGDTVAAFSAQRRAMRKSWWRWALDNYLFVRIPLVKPAPFLQRTAKHVEFLFTRASAVFFILLALLGLYLVSRQWDAFVHSFMYFFNPAGLLAYGFGIVAVKIVHELGHAYMATRYGCRVPAMGVALLVMMPVLYTDTTSAWRLRSRRQRLMIDCAGIMAELAVASIATIAWVFLPDGGLRSMAFILATTSWVMSLAINLSPFMRFDGYYVLSDMTGTPNLQARAFALGRWQLREWLFAFGDAPPEELARRTRTWMIAYAYATWVYRLLLFIGIALLVYHMFFKLLGIILFVVEIGVFVVRPVWSEIKAWHGMKERIRISGRARMIGFGLLALLVLLALPVDRHVTAPAVLSAVTEQPVVAGDPARIEQLHVRDGERVRAGDPLVTLRAPDIERQIAETRLRIEQARLQAGRAVSDEKDRANLQVLLNEVRAQESTLAGLAQRSDKLVLRAQAAGVVLDVPRDIAAGRWVSGHEVLMRIVVPVRRDARAFIGEDDLWRVERGAAARFIPDDVARPSVGLVVQEVAAAAAGQLDIPQLASTHGGPIAVSEDKDKGLRPHDSIFRVGLIARAANPAAGPMPQVLTGKVVISATPTSPLFRFFRSLAANLQSERLF
jgi:putative peptide zinc metalloprotease protein